MKVIERRYLDRDDVRATCIRNDWYDAGTCSAYERMLNMVEDGTVTTLKLYKIAKDIVIHTSRYPEKDNMEIENVMYYLDKQACVTLFTIVD